MPHLSELDGGAVPPTSLLLEWPPLLHILHYKSIRLSIVSLIRTVEQVSHCGENGLMDASEGNC